MRHQMSGDDGENFGAEGGTLFPLVIVQDAIGVHRGLSEAPSEYMTDPILSARIFELTNGDVWESPSVDIGVLLSLH